MGSNIFQMEEAHTSIEDILDFLNHELAGKSVLNGEYITEVYDNDAHSVRAEVSDGSTFLLAVRKVTDG